MFARRTAQNVLEFTTAQTLGFTEPAAVYVALLTTAPTDDTGTGLVEVSGGAYARQAATFGSVNNADPSTTANTAAVTFPQSTASWGTVVAFALYDAATAGNLLYWGWLGNYSWQPCTISAASPAVVTVGQAGYANSTTVVLDTANRFGGTSPTYSAGTPSANTVLTTAGLSGDTFTLLNGATAINASVAGSSMVRQITQYTIGASTTPSFGIGALILSAV